MKNLCPNPKCQSDRDVVEKMLEEGVASPNYELAYAILENCSDCLCYHGTVHIKRFKDYLRSERC